MTEPRPAVPALAMLALGVGGVAALMAWAGPLTALAWPVAVMVGSGLIVAAWVEWARAGTARTGCEFAVLLLASGAFVSVLLRGAEIGG